MLLDPSIFFQENDKQLIDSKREEEISQFKTPEKKISWSSNKQNFHLQKYKKCYSNSNTKIFKQQLLFDPQNADLQLTKNQKEICEQDIKQKLAYNLYNDDDLIIRLNQILQMQEQEQQHEPIMNRSMSSLNKRQDTQNLATKNELPLKLSHQRTKSQTLIQFNMQQQKYIEVNEDINNEIDQLKNNFQKKIDDIDIKNQQIQQKINEFRKFKLINASKQQQKQKQKQDKEQQAPPIDQQKNDFDEKKSNVDKQKEAERIKQKFVQLKEKQRKQGEQGTQSKINKQINSFFLLQTLYQDQQTFIHNPLPLNFKIICTIKRENEQGWNKLYPKYHLFLHTSDPNQKQFYTIYLMSAQKKMCKTSYYAMATKSLSNSFEKKSQYYQGKLRGNFFGSEFILYNNGIAPNKKSKNKLRKQLAIITYEKSKIGYSLPIKMQILIPNIDQNQKPYEIIPQNVINLIKQQQFYQKQDGMVKEYMEGNKDNMILYFKNKFPTIDVQSGNFILDFNERINQSSSKNFQIINQQANTIFLEFGKMQKSKKNIYALDIMGPFSPFQAFGFLIRIALSSMDKKLICS